MSTGTVARRWAGRRSHLAGWGRGQPKLGTVHGAQQGMSKVNSSKSRLWEGRENGNQLCSSELGDNPAEPAPARSPRGIVSTWLCHGGSFSSSTNATSCCSSTTLKCP